MIAHDQQTEGYLIVSGGGTLVTGGKIVNGRKSAPESEVTKVLNGPSCSGTTVGADIVKKVVKTGDIIIIPAGVPHGWTDIARSRRLSELPAVGARARGGLREPGAQEVRIRN